MIRSAAILAFPSGRPVADRLPGQRAMPDRLTMQDRADLARWGLISEQYGWLIGPEGGPMVEITRDGKEHVRIMLRALDDDAVYFISREWGGWVVLDRRGVASTWSSLRQALESICPTPWQGTNTGHLTPGQMPA